MRGGEYIWFVDADDLIIPQAVDLLYKRTKETNAERIIFNAYFFNEELTIGEREDFLKGNLNKKSSFDGYCWLSIYKRSFLEEKKLLFKENILYGEDEVFNYELKKNKPKTDYLDKILYCHRKHESSLMTNVDKLDYGIKRVDSIIESMYFLKDEMDKYALAEAKGMFISRQSLLKFAVSKLPTKYYKKYLKILRKNKLFSKEYYFIQEGDTFKRGNYFKFRLNLIKIRLYYVVKKQLYK